MAEISPSRTGLVKSPRSITNQDSNITKADSTASTWSSVFKYSVPLGTAFEMTPANYFHTTIKDTADNSITATAADLMRIMKANANETEKREIWRGPLTLFTGNVYDEFQRPKLRVPVLWNASQVILLDFYCATAIDGTNASFVLEGMEYYEEI